jgi:hypothetical protein
LEGEVDKRRKSQDDVLLVAPEKVVMMRKMRGEEKS